MLTKTLLKIPFSVLTGFSSVDLSLVEGKMIKDDRKPYSLVPVHTRVYDKKRQKTLSSSTSTQRVCKAGIENWWRGR
jgi:hypothetical protein